MKYDIFGDWEINIFCNFHCPYCFFRYSRKLKDPRYSGHDIREVIDAFNNTSKTWLIHMSGGEPFLQPNFIELCNEITKKHYISINSNFSTPNVYDFADKVNPRRVPRIHASLHINQRKDLDEFIKKVKYFEQLNFNTYVSQVMYPPILNNFEKTFQYLKENGILARPKVFRGFYKIKRYAKSYTEKEKNLFMKYYKESWKKSNNVKETNLDWLLSFEKCLLEGDLSFKGARCRAGKEYVYIHYNGDVIKCIGERTIKLGNIFEGKINFYKEPKLCKARICTCAHYGLKYAEKKPIKITSPLLGLSATLSLARIKEGIRHTFYFK